MLNVNETVKFTKSPKIIYKTQRLETVLKNTPKVLTNFKKA